MTTLNRSTSTWTPPQILIEDDGSRGIFNDKVSITGDPTRAGYAYATWLRWSVPPGERQSENADNLSFAARGAPMISRTTDGGATWSPAVPMRRSNSFFQGNQIAVAPDGTLYDVAATLFTGAGHPAERPGRLHGRHALPGRRPALVRAGADRTDPHRSAIPFRTTASRSARGTTSRTSRSIPTSGAIYVVWSDGLGTPINRVVMVKSTDGGRHWTAPAVVSADDPGVQAYNHAIEVTPDGTVVLAFYDDRNNVLTDGIGTTDVWVRHSHDGGATWSEQHVHGPFDHYLAPISFFAPDVPRGLFLGDYIGLEATSSNDVVAFFSSTVVDGADAHAVPVNHP